MYKHYINVGILVAIIFDVLLRIEPMYVCVCLMESDDIVLDISTLN